MRAKIFDAVPVFAGSCGRGATRAASGCQAEGRPQDSRKASAVASHVRGLHGGRTPPRSSSSRRGAKGTSTSQMVSVQAWCADFKCSCTKGWHAGAWGLVFCKVNADGIV